MLQIKMIPIFEQASKCNILFIRCKMLKIPPLEIREIIFTTYLYLMIVSLILNRLPYNVESQCTKYIVIIEIQDGPKVSRQF